MADVDALRQKAEMVTEGRWDVDWNSILFVLRSDGSGAHVAKAADAATAAHIAAWHPGIALAALRVIEAAKAVEEELAHGEWTERTRARLYNALRDFREEKVNVSSTTRGES